MTLPIIAITPGEPAGIGPDLVIQLLQDEHRPRDFVPVVIADPNLLLQRADQLNIELNLKRFNPDKPDLAPTVLPIDLASSCTAGQLDQANAPYVLETLKTAITGCLDGRFDAMVTAPVHKGIINDAGITFSGHTEYLAQQTNTDHVVMMLATNGLRVALVTTHLPLVDVAAQITATHLERVIRILEADLRHYFDLAQPRIAVLGLNPHAGEGGYMGTEEINCIIPTMNSLRSEGFNLIGPLPADTAFTEKHLSQCDVVLAMYHDQGLPVLKYKGFGNAVNITLGLPIIRTSVDHGVALDLAATGMADSGSLHTALQYALTMITSRRRR